MPFFALIATGYAAGRSSLLPVPAIQGLNAFVFYFALPALLLVKVSESSIGALLDPKVVAAYYGPSLLLFFGVFLLGRWLAPASVSVQALRSLAATFANVGFVGLPLAIMAFGDAAALPAVMVVVVDTVVMIGLTVGIVEADQGRGGSALRVVRIVFGGLIRNPLIIASFLGLIMAALSWRLPGPVNSYANLLGNAAGPCALFALGATLARRPLTQGMNEALTISAASLLLHPLLVWFAASQVFQLSPLFVAVLTVQAALPVAANVYVLAQRYDVRPAQASTNILVSTAIAIITLSAVLSWFHGNA
ncbi:AEC family transporter [Alkalilimnicola sp. S0819]|nr:AEC family transporter [Alkalilimnicola sp. S0819]MPQ17596.1 AEC family transporter [Alkalilimnicola sp. S0819]